MTLPRRRGHVARTSPRSGLHPAPPGRMVRPVSLTPVGETSRQILDLQTKIGNRAVGRLLRKGRLADSLQRKGPPDPDLARVDVGDEVYFDRNVISLDGSVITAGATGEVLSKTQRTCRVRIEEDPGGAHSVVQVRAVDFISRAQRGMIERIESFNEAQQGKDRGDAAHQARELATVYPRPNVDFVTHWAQRLKPVLQQSPLTQNVKAAVLPTYNGNRLLNGFEVAALRGASQDVGNIGTDELKNERLYAENIGLGYPFPEEAEVPEEREDVERGEWGVGQLEGLETDLNPTDPVVPPSLRPKYGALDYRNSGQGATPHQEHYGLSYFLFKSDVKKRCTYTLGDTFDAFSEGNKLFSYDNLDLLIIAAFYSADGGKLIAHLARRAGANELLEQYGNTSGYDAADQYIDTQIYGDVDLRKDVTELVLSRRELNAMGIRSKKDLAPKSLAHRIPILRKVRWRLKE